jgi:lambda family phage portal protein
MSLTKTLPHRLGYTPRQEAARLVREARLMERHRMQTHYIPRDRAERLMQRTYAAAQMSRTTGDWPTSQLSPDQDIRWGLVQVRARSRELCQNNDYAKRFLQMVQTNIVGPFGFTHQANVRNDDGTSDEGANVVIERQFAKWCKKGNCSVNGRNSFRQVQNLLIQGAARDGEFLIYLIRDKSLPFGLTLQIIPIECLDHTYNTSMPGGNMVRMGVEVNAVNRPIAYHIRKAMAYSRHDNPGFLSERLVLPAADVIHGFVPEFENQSRGMSWMVQSMIRLKMLGGYEEAGLINARTAAAKMGFYTQTSPEALQLLGDQMDTEDEGDFLETVEPGVFGKLPRGWDFKEWNPTFPTQQHEMFVKTTLRGIAAGLGVSYNLLANDLEGVNYSSIRAGLLDEREMWKLFQQWFTETVLEPVYEAWLEMAMLTNSLTLGGKSLPYAKFDKFNNPTFIGRRWAWVDPLKDVEAKKAEVAAGFATSGDVIAEKGGDMAETYQKLKEEEILRNKLGISIVLTPARDTINEPPPDEHQPKQTKGTKAVDDLLQVGPQNGNGH